MRHRKLQAGPAGTVLDSLLRRPGAVSGNQTHEDSIARDLQALLNTRRHEHLVPAGFPQCAASLLNFGVPDFTQCGNLQSAGERARLCRWFEEAIRLFEPRLSNVIVRVSASEGSRALLRFRLEAQAEFLASPVAFEMGMHRDTSEITVIAH